MSDLHQFIYSKIANTDLDNTVCSKVSKDIHDGVKAHVSNRETVMACSVIADIFRSDRDSTVGEQLMVDYGIKGFTPQKLKDIGASDRDIKTLKKFL